MFLFQLYAGPMLIRIVIITTACMVFSFADGYIDSKVGVYNFKLFWFTTLAPLFLRLSFIVLLALVHLEEHLFFTKIVVKKYWKKTTKNMGI